MIESSAYKEYLKQRIGRNEIYCQGRVIGGNMYQKQIVSFIIGFYIVGFMLYSILITPLFLNGISSMNKNIWIPTITSFLFVPGLYYYIRCYFGDPGIIPKNFFRFSLSEMQTSNELSMNINNKLPRIYT